MYQLAVFYLEKEPEYPQTTYYLLKDGNTINCLVPFAPLQMMTDAGDVQYFPPPDLARMPFSAPLSNAVANGNALPLNVEFKTTWQLPNTDFSNISHILVAVPL